MMGHVLLLGDSVFDNGLYVPNGPAVGEQLRSILPKDWRVSMLARDGATTSGVAAQLRGMPADATHLVISVGGNDALGYAYVVDDDQLSATQAFVRLLHIQQEFESNYRAMLKGVLALGKLVALCTVYDSVPGLRSEQRTALCAWNDVILRQAFAAKLPVIDLRLVCSDSSDYSGVSPIEPSEIGGSKIVRAVRHFLLSDDPRVGASRVYTS